MSTEQKTITFQVKDLGITTDASGQEFGQIEAYGAIFNNVDDGKDRILPGAFTRTIKNSKERATARQKKYLAPMLWQHNTSEVIGGWYEMSEDGTGLRAKGDINLATQRGREYYALAKAGMADQFSIIYDVPAGGAKYDKSGVRDLSELRLFSIDPVTFAMNDATFLVDVKAQQGKASDDTQTVVGNIKGPLGPRDEAWDGGEAEGQIWAVAYDDDTSTVDKALASKYFMLRSGDGTKKGDYELPFWYVGSSPHICVGAVKAIAGVIQGSRGATTDYPDGVKTNVEKLYKRINAKYPDDPQLTPPWKSDDSGEKGKQRMARNKAARPSGRSLKTFQEHLNADMCQDLMTDWHDVIIHAFTCSVVDAFSIGDQPEADVSDALDAFKTAVMVWVAQAVECGLSDYLDAQGGSSWSPADYPMQYGDDSKPDYYGCFLYGMSRPLPLMKAGKAMTAGDATTGGFTADHVEKLKNASSKAKETVASHAGMLQDQAEEVKSMLDSASKAAKAGRTFSASNEQALTDHADALSAAAKSLTKAMNRHMGTVSSVADDLATVLQGNEPAYGTDEGDAGDAQEGKDGKQQHRAPSGLRHYGAYQTRAPHTPPSRQEDTVDEDEIAHALTGLKALRAQSA